MNVQKVISWLIGFIAVMGVGYFILRPRPSSLPINSASTVLTVPEGEAGKVGEVQVTEEALQLAKITVAQSIHRMVEEKIVVSGSVRAGGNQLVKVTPRTAGKVIKLLAQEGDSIRAGQTLAVVESTDLAEAQAHYRQSLAKASASKQNLKRQQQLASLGQFGRPALEQARNRSVEADTAINKAESFLSSEKGQLAEVISGRDALNSQVAVAQAEFDVASTEVNRAESLFKEELISKQELERVRADFQKAAAELAAAKAALAQGDTRIATARASVASAESALRLAKQQAVIAKQALEREERVYKGQFSTSREIVDAESQLRQIQVEVEGSADKVRLLGGTPGGGNTFSLSSPISGRVQERPVSLGEAIDPEHTAFVVVNLDQVWADLAISANDLASIRVGDPVDLTSEATRDRTFRGSILTIGTETSASTRTVSVRTTLGNLGHLLKPGSFVSGSVVTDVRQQRTTVPIGALQDHTGKPTVYVELPTPGTFEVRHVVLGETGEGWREIKSGLKAGERIAVTGTFYLKSEALKSSLSDGCCAPGA